MAAHRLRLVTTNGGLRCVHRSAVIVGHTRGYWALRLAGFPVNIVYAARIEGVGLAQATYVFDPGTFIQGEQTRQMRYRPTIESDFSVLVVLHPEGRVQTFKYRGSELICEACGPDFRTAMIHTAVGGIAIDEPWTRVETVEPSAAAQRRL